MSIIKYRTIFDQFRHPIALRTVCRASDAWREKMIFDRITVQSGGLLKRNIFWPLNKMICV